MNETEEKHRKSPFWQVIFPLLVGTIVMLAVAVWAVIASAGGADLSRYADTSAVVFVILAILLSLIPLFLLGGIAYGLYRLSEVIPRGTRWLARAASQLEELSRRAATIIVEPVLRVESFLAGLKRIFNRRK